MVTFDNKPDDLAHEDQKQKSSTSTWDRPLLLAGLGLVLMLGGYAAIDYVSGARLAIFGGLIFFVLAGVLMYRSPAPTTKDNDESE
jgi:hypothetical protein